MENERKWGRKNLHVYSIEYKTQIEREFWEKVWKKRRCERWRGNAIEEKLVIGKPELTPFQMKVWRDSVWIHLESSWVVNCFHITYLLNSILCSQYIYMLIYCKYIPSLSMISTSRFYSIYYFSSRSFDWLNTFLLCMKSALYLYIRYLNTFFYVFYILNIEYTKVLGIEA